VNTHQPNPEVKLRASVVPAVPRPAATAAGSDGTVS
jgi:hypothetical protein